MICWILNKDLNAYKHLCESEGYAPLIIKQTEDKSHVQMSAHSATMWNMAGYWYEMG